MNSIQEISPGVYTINMASYVVPKPKEQIGRKWVTLDKDGEKHGFFQYIIDRSKGSPTNQTVLRAFENYYYGRGIVVKGQEEIYEDLNEIYPKTEQKKNLADRKKFFMYARQIQRAKGGGVAKITHFPMEKLAFEKANEKGEITHVYYCFDWSNTHKYKPQRLPLYTGGKLTESLMIQVIKPYQSDSFYYNVPDYSAVLPYCEFEEELANFYINQIQNGLTPRAVINFNNGQPSDEMKDKMFAAVHNNFAGSNGMPYVVSFNDSADTATTVDALDINDAHQQWEFLTEEAKSQIITGHGGFPNLFGIPTANGLSNNADELDVQSKILQDLQVTPAQMEFIESLKPLLELNNLETDLEFLPLRETYKSTESTPNAVVDETVDEEKAENPEEEAIEMSSDVTYNIDAFLEEGEDIGEDWELIEERDCHKMTLSETDLNTIFHFARVPKDDKNIEKSRSSQDTSLFKIRYQYAGNPLPEREFCQKVMHSGKVFKAETLNKEQFITPKMGKGGSNTYNPFLYKGGVNCKHWWKRVIYLKKGNEQISVNQARKMILELEPEDRDDARWEQNPPEVAQSASASNNYWKAS